MYYLLNYDYVPDILTRREPHRAEHLQTLKSYQERDELVLAGAVGEPVSGATFVFKVNSAAMVQAFVDSDPYVANQLVTEYRIEPWTVVIGSAYQPD